MKNQNEGRAADRRDYRQSLIWKRNGIDEKLERARKPDRNGFTDLTAIARLIESRRVLDSKIKSAETQIAELTGKRAA